MGCCNEPGMKLTTGLPTDLSQHVNYERGMVLGVDDFRQEFAYQSERDQWLARDAIGYGTLSGLKVYTEDSGADGPRLHVASGSALAVGGKLICVAADQCCVLNKWLAKTENATIVNRLLHGTPPTALPPAPAEGMTGTISLYLTLCYTDCTTAPVPIPGEPCRSEDQLMADSRIADDFCLELRADAPPQVEEDALRDFVQWLKHNVQVLDASSPPIGDETSWLAGLRGAVKPWTDALNASPPLSPPASVGSLGDYLFDLSPADLEIGQDQLEDFLRVALRFWVTELRPMWMAVRCHQPQHKDVDCLLLARVIFEVTWAGGSPAGVWQVSGSPPTVLIDESTRPIIVQMRLQQEWMHGSGGGTASVASSSLPQALSAADSPTFSGLTLTGGVKLPIEVTSTNIALNDSHQFVVCDGGQTVNLPKCTPNNKGRTYNIRSMGASSTLAPAAGDAIVGGASVAVSNPKIVVSDGASTWYVF